MLDLQDSMDSSLPYIMTNQNMGKNIEGRYHWNEYIKMLLQNILLSSHMYHASHKTKFPGRIKEKHSHSELFELVQQHKQTQ